MRGRPSVRISVNGETQEACLELYRAGKVDAAILFCAPETVLPGAHIIGEEPLRLVVAPGHPLAGRKELQLADLAGFDFVGGLRDSQFFGLIEASLRAAGLPRYNVVLHMQDSVAIKNAIVHGLGIACTLASVVADEVAAGKLVVLDVAEQLPPLAVAFLADPQTADHASMRALTPFLRRGFSAGAAAKM
jgi:DNA-binding transcriptional LysR family regulator